MIKDLNPKNNPNILNNIVILHTCTRNHFGIFDIIIILLIYASVSIMSMRFQDIKCDTVHPTEISMNVHAV